MTNTYSNKFSGKNTPQYYDDNEYKDGSYSDLLWTIEKEQLLNIINRLKNNCLKVSYLDFASGTGRIISFVETYVDYAVGIEVSSEMASVAKDKVSNAKIECIDITQKDFPVIEKYDLITAFRFFLNAEPDLQKKAMQALAVRLKDNSSLLVFNNHGNFWSHKIFMWPFHKIFNIGKVNKFEGNYMTFNEVKKLSSEAGLVIEDVFGCGFLSAKFRVFCSHERQLKIEKFLSRFRFLSYFAVNQMYVVRLK